MSNNVVADYKEILRQKQENTISSCSKNAQIQKRKIVCS